MLPRTDEDAEDKEVSGALSSGSAGAGAEKHAKKGHREFQAMKEARVEGLEGPALRAMAFLSQVMYSGMLLGYRRKLFGKPSATSLTVKVIGGKEGAERAYSGRMSVDREVFSPQEAVDAIPRDVAVQGAKLVSAEEAKFATVMRLNKKTGKKTYKLGFFHKVKVEIDGSKVFELGTSDWKLRGPGMEPTSLTMFMDPKEGLRQKKRIETARKNVRVKDKPAESDATATEIVGGSGGGGTSKGAQQQQQLVAKPAGGDSAFFGGIADALASLPTKDRPKQVRVERVVFVFE